LKFTALRPATLLTRGTTILRLASRDALVKYNIGGSGHDWPFSVLLWEIRRSGSREFE